jgi:hypothetical protein
MQKIQNLIIPLILLFNSNLLAQDKHLILAEGNTWIPLMPPNLIEHHEAIKKLPFSGFVMVGNSYTKEVMKEGTEVSYRRVWHEVKGLKELYKNRHNFMQINMEFPADFWDDGAWEKVIKNFATVAKVAKDLNFKGIVFDDEPYTNSSHKMNNFKFPSKIEVRLRAKKYTSWEKKGSEESWVDERGYRNLKYSFAEHMEKVTLRFETIMKAMEKSYPNLTLLVYNGPSFSHMNSNKKNIIVTDVGMPREHEYKGAIFAGLQKGLEGNVSLHDMGESYKYRTSQHFNQAYQWRKYDIAKDKYNELDSSYQWTLPKEQRASWSKDVKVGFMVFNKGQESNYKEYDTRENSSIKNIKSSLIKALSYSDNYVIYYAQDQDWLLPNQKYPLDKKWITMIKEVELLD